MMSSGRVTMSDETSTVRSNVSSELPHAGASAVCDVSSIEDKRKAFIRKVSHKNSGIHEPQNVESDEDPFTLTILNPLDNRPIVWFVRALLFWGGYFVCGFYITFGQDSSYWAIGLGGVFAYCVVLGMYLLEAYVIIPWWYESSIGKPMVHWMSWGVFLDIIYHVINPRNKKDCRVDVYSQQETPIIKEQLNEEKQEFWLDFCADVGDGFNPTFAVFSTIAQSTLKLSKDVEIPRADAVVIGGDIAYPWPRHEELLSRFLRPLSWAYPREVSDRDRGIYIMPGNHEWADGLRNFRRLILERPTGMIGGWSIRNRTPYFCIKLPFNWWMFCVDPGSEACQDMDAAQIAYFSEIIDQQTKPSDRFILAVHEPDWIKNSLHGFALFKQLATFRRDVLGERLRVTLAGDLHYYRRMEETEGGKVPTRRLSSPYPHYVTHKRQLIVSGNGGAFSHPTYVPCSSGGIRLGEPHFIDSPHYSDACNYPTPQESRETYSAKWLAGFSFGKNYGFGSILGMSFVGMTLAVSPLDYSPDGVMFPNGHHVLENVSYLLRMIRSFWFYPSAIFLAAVIFIIASTSSPMRTLKTWVTAISMTLIHIVLQFGLCLSARKLIDTAWAQALWQVGLELEFWRIVLFCFLSNVSLYAVGYFFAPLLTAFYLYLSQNVVKSAYNEPMSTIEHQDDKGFCRMHFTADGDIDFFHIGIKKVPRRWVDTQACTASPSYFKGADIDVEPFIVERVLIKRNRDEEPSLDLQKG